MLKGPESWCLSKHPYLVAKSMFLPAIDRKVLRATATVRRSLSATCQFKRIHTLRNKEVMGLHLSTCQNSYAFCKPLSLTKRRPSANKQAEKESSLHTVLTWVVPGRTWFASWRPAFTKSIFFVRLSPMHNHDPACISNRHWWLPVLGRPRHLCSK